jgi:electron transport complex protein RnfC
MSLATFKLGGIHPPEMKEFSGGSAIESAKPPKRAFIPLSQHIGAPCKPMVEAGAHVLTGQQIGNPEGFVSAPVHSSISGKVAGIENLAAPNGRMIPCIVIDNDNSNGTVHPEDDSDYLQRTGDELRQRIKTAGIVGMGGATFPTHVKLSPPKEKPIDAVILNGAECEPYLTSDHRMMLENSRGIVAGLKILMKVLNVKKGYIGIENNKPDAVKAIGAAVKDCPEHTIEILTLKVKYPQGAEKMLIKTVLDRDVPAGGLPMDVGVVVQNVGTAYAIYEACRFGRPLIERVVSVTGAGLVKPKNLRVKIGTPVSQLIEECGGIKDSTVKIISGGPMMGFAIYSLATPVTKGTSGIVAMEGAAAASGGSKFANCIRCGRCVDACPMGLMPMMLSLYSQKSRFEECKEYNLFDCFECGSCTYVCPAKRPIVQQIRLAKSQTKP